VLHGPFILECDSRRRNPLAGPFVDVHEERWQVDRTVRRNAQAP
jgi:hypothetical protein